MKKTKPVSHAEIIERALWIACDMFEMLETELEPGKGLATARQIRRFLTGKARKELLKERREAKKEPRTP